jgi:hypothetical protein
VVVAGDLFTGSNVPYCETFLETGEIGVRAFAMVHEPAIVSLKDPNARLAHMRVGVARDEVLHMGRKFLDVAAGEEDIEFRFETPDNIAGFDGLSGEDAYSLDGTIREIGADKHHGDLDPNGCEVDLVFLKLDGIAPGFLRSRPSGRPRPRRRLSSSHMCFFNILQR